MEAGLKDMDRPPDRNLTYAIGDLSREFDVTQRALRFYEDKGLLHPRRRGRSRVYSRRDRARLKLILMGKRIGFSLREIREILDLYDLRGGEVTQLKLAADRFQTQIQSLKAQRAEIDTAIRDLTRTYEVIAGMLKQREG